MQPVYTATTTNHVAPGRVTIRTKHISTQECWDTIAERVRYMYEDGAITAADTNDLLDKIARRHRRGTIHHPAVTCRVL